MSEAALPLRTACGFVLVRPGPAGLEYLTLVNSKRGEPGLPKGHSAPGETEMETALRETHEETGLRVTDVRGDFRVVIKYHATRRGSTYRKHVVYFAAHAPRSRLRLSKEHSGFAWQPLAQTLAQLPHESLKQVVRRAALFFRDPALYDLEPLTEAAADAYLAALPEAGEALLGHLRGAARLARTFAEALAREGVPVHVEAAAAGALLHDVGRAIGRHADHQRAGTKHLRKHGLGPYGFACVTHSTKGARAEELLDAGLDPGTVAAYRKLVDLRSLSWEERCCALADSCMRGSEAVPPRERFEDLRRRYDDAALIALQEFKTAGIRRGMQAVLGRDPLELVGLAGEGA